jgi:hypothetical protein
MPDHVTKHADPVGRPTTGAAAAKEMAAMEREAKVKDTDKDGY